MANNTIQVTYKVNEDGSLEKIATKANKAAAATENLNKKKNTYNKQEKGVGQLTSNSTKAFAKQASSINGGLVPAYATLAANVFAVTAAFGVLQRAASVQQLEAGLMAVGRSGGANLKIVSEGLREVTALAVSTQEAMEATAIATSAGFSESQILSLGEVAKGASLALGRDMADALTRLTRGTSKLEPELLDELGIFVKLEQATTEHAARLGKSADELTQFERRQAFVNAAIDEGQKKFGTLNEFVDANPYDKLAASFADLTKKALNFVNNVITPFVSFLAESPIALVGLFAAFASGIVGQILPSIQASAEAAKAASKQLSIQASKASKVVSDDYKKAAASVVSSWKTVPKSLEGIEDKFKKGTYSAKELKLAITRLKQSEKLRANAKVSSDSKIAAARAKELAEVRALRIEMEKLKLAESSRFTASAAGIKAQRGSVAAGLTARGLSEMDKANGIMQKFGVATRYSNLQFANLGRTAGFLPKVSVGLRAAAGAARLFGSALLSAIPIIGQILVFGPLIYDAFKWLFTTPPSLLDKELEKAAKRYEEFDNVIDQLAISYSKATRRAEAFSTALKPGVGLLKQTREQIEAIANAQQNEADQRVRSAQTKVIMAEIALERAKKENKEKAGKERPGVLLSKSEQALLSRIASLTTAKKEAEEALQEAQNIVLDEKAIEGVLTGIGELKSGFTALQEVVEPGTTEYNMYRDSLKELDDVLETAISGNIPKAIEMLKTLETRYEAEAGANNAAVEIMQKFAAAAAKAKASTGEFAETIKLLTEANNNLASAKASETIAEFSDAFDRFGISYDKTIKDLNRGDIITPEQIESLNSAKIKLKELENRYKAFNITSKSIGVSQEIIANHVADLERAGMKALALEIELSAAKMQTAHAQERADLLRDDNEASIEEKNAAILALLKAQNAEKLKQLEISKQIIADAERLGGEGAGAAMSSTEFVKNNIEKFDTASLSEKVKMVSDAFNPMIEQIKKLGPDGELVSTAIQGALLVSEAWLKVGEVFSSTASYSASGMEGTLGTAERATAALGAIGASLNSINNILQASSQARIAQIDREIEAEKRRDGKSAQSVAKISALEKKKENEKRKAFEINKKMQMAMVVVNTAMAVSAGIAAGAQAAIATGGVTLPAWVGAYTALVTTLGAIQLGLIASTSYQGGGSIGGAKGPSSITVGSRNNSVDLAKARSPSGEIAYARGDQGTGSGMTNFTPAFTGMKYRASGGNVGLMVGEQGPEMFIPDRPGTVVPADDTQAFSGQPVNVNFSIQAVDSAGVEDLLRVQRGNIIGMIREAANSHGELFLENINDQALPVSRQSRRY